MWILVLALVFTPRSILVVSPAPLLLPAPVMTLKETVECASCRLQPHSWTAPEGSAGGGKLESYKIPPVKAEFLFRLWSGRWQITRCWRLLRGTAAWDLLVLSAGSAPIWQVFRKKYLFSLHFFILLCHEDRLPIEGCKALLLYYLLCHLSITPIFPQSLVNFIKNERNDDDFSLPQHFHGGYSHTSPCPPSFIWFQVILLPLSNPSHRCTNKQTHQWIND